MEVLIQNCQFITWQMLVMWDIGAAARFSTLALLLYDMASQLCFCSTKELKMLDY